MYIFKTKAANEQTPTDTQRVRREVSRAQRVTNETQGVTQYDTPYQNTRSRSKLLFSATKASVSFPTVQQYAQRHYPLQFLEEFAGVVIDDDTGKILPGTGVGSVVVHIAALLGS